MADQIVGFVIECAEELADRLTGQGISALRADDWPILVAAVESMIAQAKGTDEKPSYPDRVILRAFVQTAGGPEKCGGTHVSIEVPRDMNVSQAIFHIANVTHAEMYR